MHWIEDVSLIGTQAKWVVNGCAIAAGVFALLHALRHKRLKATATVVVTSAALVMLSKYLIEHVWRPFPEAIPWQIYACFGGAIIVLCLAWLHPRTPWMVLFVVMSLIGALGSTNLVYQMYPNLAAFEKDKYSKAMSVEEFKQAEHDGGLPTTKGVKLTLSLPASSKFTPRDAQVYLPPAYWQGEKLPVIVLMAGNPGSPSDWFNSALADRTADDYQKRHGGVAPIIVSVDATGSYAANPVCADSGDKKVTTYIAQDVPKELKKVLKVDDNPQHWTIGGLSYGGTCSLQVVTNFPEAYGSFLDFSGQKEPTTGKHDETVRKFFNGSEEQFKAHNPADLLQKHQGDGTYRAIAGKFVAGEKDEDSQHALSHLNELALKAGMDAEYFTVAGGHDFSTWRHALEQTFDWAAQRGGL
ncbi:alpha/beta hydrolase [Corynebacterium gerontici]|uniref:Endo-1,4-beta-xylanase Z n=1 Tax=Corynebacterium gerontici TaxID=2079234 RepID=A0A3G6J0Q0_9CORY|nr:alpha/beta hydrolase-fold protein [Corynebacterium gerontici]AZA11373.1 Endo-1,4-beta-xylanase Z precursor [Corynebacterium gerontici]